MELRRKMDKEGVKRESRRCKSGRFADGNLKGLKLKLGYRLIDSPPDQFWVLRVSPPLHALSILPCSPP